MTAHEMLKQQTEQAYKESNMGAMCNEPPDRPKRRPSLVERAQRQLDAAQMEARRADQLHELLYLLEKNPEVARILDLIEAVKG